MSLLRKIFFVFVISITISSCGFSPVHKRNGAGSSGSNAELAAIELGEIQIEGKRIQQLFRTQINKELNPLNSSVPTKYRLDVSLNRTVQDLGVKQDKEITRYNLVYAGEYILRDKETRKELKVGKTRIAGGYDAVASDFATYAARKNVEERIIGELARDIKLRLSSFLAN